jgi:aspartate-semialdehyde dehydrogenase
MQNKLRVGILGATGTVGQKFIALLKDHPWFDVTCVAASSHSAGKIYAAAVENRWTQDIPIPDRIRDLKVLDGEHEIKSMASRVDFIFSALSMDKAKIRDLECLYASEGLPVVSNNSAHRWTEDVPMLIPEINHAHLKLIDTQRNNRGWTKGLITVKPNCSIQSFVPVLDAFKPFGLEKVIVSTYQAISGAGKTFETAPEIVDNIIPYISGEEKKSEDEPMKIWATIEQGQLRLAEKPVISSNCVRVPVSDGHLVTVNVGFRSKPTLSQLIEVIKNYHTSISDLNLPSSPDRFLCYLEDENRPQSKLDRNLGNGMSISVGRFREDNILDWKFVALSHNTIRGAAGGAILTAELLTNRGYIQ